MKPALYAPASLMGLPVEIRLQIYKEVIAPTTFKVGRERWHPRFRSITAFEVQLIGTAPKRYNTPMTNSSYNTVLPDCISHEPWAVPRRHSVWALAFVCRKMSREVAPLLGEIDIGEEVHFSFFGFTKEDLAVWTRKMGPERLDRVRRWSMEGFGFCNMWVQQAKEPCLQPGMVSLKCLPILMDTAKDLLGKDHWGPGEFDSIGYCYRDIIVDLRTWVPEFPPSRRVPNHSSWQWASEQNASWGRVVPTYSDRCCGLPDGRIDHTRCSWAIRNDLSDTFHYSRPDLKGYPNLTMSLDFLSELLGYITDVPPLHYIQTRAEGQ